MMEYIEEEKEKDEDSDQSMNAVQIKAPHTGTDAHEGGHHKVRRGVLPGVFFLYEIYPFAVEVSQRSVPITHLLIRLMATIGGVFTVVRWADSYLYERDRAIRRRSSATTF